MYIGQLSQPFFSTIEVLEVLQCWKQYDALFEASFEELMFPEVLLRFFRFSAVLCSSSILILRGCSQRAEAERSQPGSRGVGELSVLTVETCFSSLLR